MYRDGPSECQFKLSIKSETMRCSKETVVIRGSNVSTHNFKKNMLHSRIKNWIVGSEGIHLKVMLNVYSMQFIRIEPIIFLNLLS